MRAHEDDLERWRQAWMDPSALPTRAADLMDAGRDVPPLAPAVLARIERDVIAERPSRSRGLPLGLRFAMPMVVLLASVATAKGTMLLWRHYTAPPAPAPAPATHHATRAARPAAPVIEPLSPVAEPSVVETDVAPAPAPPRARKTPHPTLSPAGRGQDDPYSEAQLLAEALAQLRQAHDARGALALLDQYRKAFPRGVLASEALSARLEAVLELDDRKAALVLLDGRGTFAGRLGAEQLATRAELRANAGRYGDALRDFDQLLDPAIAGAAPPTLRERALYGRAVSFGHLGRDDRARADLVAYQAAFPTGKHAAEVTRLLKNASAPPRP